jgi:hypothetical protein
MFKFNAFYQDDKVTYVGQRWAKELGGKMGWVIGPVTNEENVYVVEFEGDSYIMPLTSLTKFTASSARDSGPEIRQIRKRSIEDEPGTNVAKRPKYSAGQK